ncbi:MAG: DUF1800 domain-containing protein [Blastocatellia bacterium]
MTTPLTYDDTAHLLRRMGFGGSATEINALVPMGREGAANFLINYQAIDDSALETVLSNSFDFSDPTNNKAFNANEIRRWWYTRMALTKRQFQEKMTLFWHDHFATALSKVQDTYMYIQNLTLRSHALDQFDNLLLEVARDPAMLIWLDGITNINTAPNENFGRELEELFTMGINDVVAGTPNYTQTDVEQIARAFTGWKFTVSRANLFSPQFIENASQHDNGSKTIYGETANFDGTDVITLICARQATPRFIINKMFAFFVYPLDLTNQADLSTIDKFAAVYMSNNHSIQELVRSLFTSDEFFSDRARFALIKNPAELIVGAIRMLGGQYNPGSLTRRDGTLYTRSQNMGLDIFNPPDVSGWKPNLGWINTGAMLERFNYADLYVTNRFTNSATPGPSVSNTQLQSYIGPTAKKTVKNVLQALGPLVTDTHTVKVLRNYLQTDDNGNPTTFTGDATGIDEKMRGLVHQIMCLPEFQLN